MQKKILSKNLVNFIILFFLLSCSSVPKHPTNACKIFGERYFWYKHAKKSSETYGAPIHMILAFVKKESGFNRWAKPKRKKSQTAASISHGGLVGWLVDCLEGNPRRRFYRSRRAVIYLSVASAGSTQASRR